VTLLSNRPWKSIGLWDVKIPTCSKQSAHRWQWGCHLYALATLYPRNIPGTHFCRSLSGPQRHSAAGKIRSIEKSSDLIVNRIHDLLVCSMVPEPTALPRATLWMCVLSFWLVAWCLNQLRCHMLPCECVLSFSLVSICVCYPSL
jgi:hypothetical protein